MSEFKLVDFKSVSPEMREEVLRNFRKIYSRLYPSLAEFVKQFKLDAYNIKCMVKGGRLIGAVSYRIKHRRSLHLGEIWAKPSREHYRVTGKTVAQVLQDYVEGLAKKKGVPLTVDFAGKPGKKFKKRLDGELPKGTGQRKRNPLRRKNPQRPR